MDECVSDEATSCMDGPGRVSGEGVEGPETTADAGFDTSTCMGASVSPLGIEGSGMVTELSGRPLKIRLTAMIPAAPVSALKSAPT